VTLSIVALRAIMPGIRDAEDWLVPINSAAEEFDFTQPARMAAWLANVAHETSNLSRLVESFSYSPERMAAVWPRRFSAGRVVKDGKVVETPNAAAMAFASRPEALASEVYGNRMGNGEPETMDGWKYRGRGTPMLTGRSLYEQCGVGLQVDFIAKPESINQDRLMSARVGGWFYKYSGVAQWSDFGDIRNVRKAWNGGLIGFAEVQRIWLKACRQLEVDL
jgi:putative chitinase